MATYPKGVAHDQNLFQIGDASSTAESSSPPKRDPVASYVTLDEALACGLRIREVDESGSVAELVVENPLAERALLYDGEKLVLDDETIQLTAFPSETEDRHALGRIARPSARRE
jgi:ARG and Rhodanese-Phosphatase-superfamily-associated Protein domain